MNTDKTTVTDSGLNAFGRPRTPQQAKAYAEIQATDSGKAPRKTFQNIAIEALQQIEACDAGAICCREIAREALRAIYERKATFRTQMDKALKSVGI